MQPVTWKKSLEGPVSKNVYVIFAIMMGAIKQLLFRAITDDRTSNGELKW